MATAVIELIKGAPLFEGLGEEALMSLTQGSFVQRYPSNVALFDEGETSPFVYVLLEGQIERFSTHRGRESGLGFIYPSAAFILSCAITQTPNTFSARTLSNSRFVLVPAQNVRTLFGANLQFARNVARDIADCEQEVMAELKNQKLRTMAERLANWILLNVPGDAQGQWTRLPMSKQALALYLGTTPENLWRSFVALEPHGVGVRRREVLVSDFGKLIEFAGPNPLIDRRPRQALAGPELAATD
ncbi:cyclic nucleotide-binding domain-containing protein [Alsobacter soli]|uniref:cyclic nucleotide-binding domain-containing protein n=1 Tax=Alsobacter soli TaxID=2109933 RepID=UPI001304F297|nr:cyclic nucleotide-binding domain-containing protein [Alsobacter soli]